MANEFVQTNQNDEANDLLRLQMMSLRDSFRQHQNQIRNQYDISETEMEIILYVDKHGAQKMKHIGETFGIKFSTLTSLVDKIELIGLIKRVNSKEDRRSVLITLTKKGKKLVDEYDQQAIKYSDLIAKQNDDSPGIFARLLRMITPESNKLTQ
ncbi:MAG: MarR family transcriptional regulator [Bacteroidia bacterium]|nr:MarR family transcriptional regulator [Bacteroidia bacterium]